MTKRAVTLLALLGLVLAAALVFIGRDDAPAPAPSARGDRAAARTSSDRDAADAPAARRETAAEDADGDTEPDADEAEDADAADAAAEPLTEEEKAEQEEERRVEAFDDTVDKWMEPTSNRTVSMADVDAFRDAFSRVPQPRKEECLQRALNLIPDEHVMLLAGILFDKSQEPELLDLVYNDILNRDEDVKQPVLKQLYKDKSHPNWADTAWILDMTDSLPKQETTE